MNHILKKQIVQGTDKGGDTNEMTNFIIFCTALIKSSLHRFLKIFTERRNYKNCLVHSGVTSLSRSRKYVFILPFEPTGRKKIYASNVQWTYNSVITVSFYLTSFIFVIFYR